MSEQARELGGTTVPLKGIRRAAARQMVRAWEAPAFTLTVAVDMARLLERKKSGSTVTDALICAVASVLRAQPALNAWFGDDGVTTFPTVNIGLAVATDSGLMVPVIHDAGALDIGGISAARREVVGRARAGSLGIDDVTGGTFTISNLGMAGIDRFTAILNVPQVAILAVGATTERFVRVDGVESWRPMADFTMTFDHRAVDGSAGAAFLAALREQVERGA